MKLAEQENSITANNPQQTGNSLLWFRNDIRIIDNPALEQAMQHGVCKAIFIATPKQWQQHDWAPIKVDFLKRHVRLLAKQLAALGIDLVVVQVDDFAAQIDYLKQFCQQHHINKIFANQELEVNEVLRDKTLQDHGAKHDLRFTLFEADVFVPKGEVLNKQGQAYKVFTPFSKALLTHLRQHGFELANDSNSNALARTQQSTSNQDNLAQQSTGCDYDWHYKQKDSSAWPLANQYIESTLSRFLSKDIHRYGDRRDIPSEEGTSKISPYLAIGAISPKYLLKRLMLTFPDILQGSPQQPSIWLNELIWREFYRNLLFHFPNLCRHYNYNETYNRLNWVNDLAQFEAWCQGKTGYPIVDAAMRQLVQTGWMHNRLRMITASFLTKHLLIDWRWGEQFFMQHLIDGDLASNNGGWQWAASTGCDAQPYFRIFNPINQSKRFDPSGAFIRTYIPELAKVKTKEIHFPAKADREQKPCQYCLAIVDHKAARARALDRFKAARVLSDK